VSVFFPYLKGPEVFPNRSIGLWIRCFEHAKTRGIDQILQDAASNPSGWYRGVPGGVRFDTFPQGISKVPVTVKWEDADLTQELQFRAGVFAIHQHPDGALEPRTGWAVAEAVADQAKR
jgi:hypothetical protein